MLIEEEIVFILDESWLARTARSANWTLEEVIRQKMIHFVLKS
jgi:hypothetical protein